MITPILNPNETLDTTPAKMLAKLKADWITALRSGKYEQGREGLRIVTKTAEGDEKVAYCCLGVLCIVDGIEPERIHGGYLTNFPELNRMLGGVSRAELDQITEKCSYKLSPQQCLARLNDCNRASFVEIADWIEANIEVEPS